jgi:type I restriction-modification system DNA methylase subunit
MARGTICEWTKKGEATDQLDLSSPGDIFAQESTYTNWGIAEMKLAIRGTDAQIASDCDFCDDGHPNREADAVHANSSFNASDRCNGLVNDEMYRVCRARAERIADQS